MQSVTLDTRQTTAKIGQYGKGQRLRQPSNLNRASAPFNLSQSSRCALKTEFDHLQR